MLRTTSRAFLRRQTRCSRRWASTQPKYEEFDIVIVGGGPAGLALASALGSKKAVQSSLKIALVEGGDLDKVRSWQPTPGTFSNRVSSLTNVSQAFLRDTGAWEHVDMERTSAIQDMQVWDGLSDARITFASSEIGLEDPAAGMARLTENLNLQRGLLRHLASIPSVQIHQRTKVQSITPDDESKGKWPLVHLDNNLVFRTRLLVGADGFNSPVRSYAGISSYGWAYDTQAIVSTMDHPPRGAFQNPNNTAYQRFLPTGPIAFLPLSPTTSSLVWSTKPPLAAALLASEPGVLAKMINAAFRLPEVSIRYLHSRILERHAVGTPITLQEVKDEILFRELSHGIDSTSALASGFADATSLKQAGIPPLNSEAYPPLVTSIQSNTMASFPLRFNHTDSYLGEGKGARTVLVGDAAHTIHPLAGQGLNLGLGDVECLTKCIHKAVLQGGDVGSYTALLPYAQERYFENHKIMSVNDKLHKLYSTTLAPVVWARTVGLEILNEFDSIKAGIMMTAGSTPRKEDDPGRAAWSTAFSTAASGIQAAFAATNTIKLVRDGVAGAAVNTLQQLLKHYQKSDAGKSK